jgi:hypothetical protein
MEFKDTQCGAKIMHKEIVEKRFRKKFLTKWLFDRNLHENEKIYGKQGAIDLICERPLNRWVHMDGSKLSLKILL